MTKNKLILTIAISVISINLGLSQDNKYYDLKSIDSISYFFHARELDDLYALDNYFIDFVIKEQNDIDKAYKDYLKQLIQQIEKSGEYYSCDNTMLVDLAKMDLKSKISLITYGKIFNPHLDRYYTDSDTISVYWDNINVKGKWMKFLSYYSKTDTIWKGYVEGIENSGTFPMFLDTLDSYVKMLDFNNQTHRLIVLIHLMGQSSMWTYEDC
jgi:hypothetical protein